MVSIPTYTHPKNHFSSHKPFCKCPPCKRKTEALTRAAGDGTLPVETDPGYQAAVKSVLDVLHADDLPVLIAPCPDPARARIIEYIKWRAEGLNVKQIAEKFGITASALYLTINKATRQGWLKFDDPLERFQQEIVPKVVDNIEHFINAKDRTMTIEAAKGAGIFKSFQSIKTEGEAPTTVLAIKIETAPPADAPTSIPGIVGRPRTIEIEKE